MSEAVIEPHLVPLNAHRDPIQQLIDSEPPTHAIIACEVQTGPVVAPRWEKRTYEALRFHLAGRPTQAFVVHFGESAGPGERFLSWELVVRFLKQMRARNVEIVIQ